MRNDTFEESKPFIKLRSKSGAENVHYSIFYKDFPEEFKIIANKKLNETADNRKEGLEKLKEFGKRENLPDMEEHNLLMILRNCKYDIKKSEAKMKKYIFGRRELKKALVEMGLEKIETIIDDMPFGVLPYRDKHGRCILYNRLGALDFEKYGMFDVCALIAASALFLLNYPITSVTGFATLAECKLPSLYMYYPMFKGVMRFLPIVVRLPIRTARFEVLKENYLVWCFFKIIGPILKQKVVERFSFHGDSYSHLHQHYDPDLLPEYFGGNLGPLNTSAYKEKFLAFVMDFMKENL